MAEHSQFRPNIPLDLVVAIGDPFDQIFGRKLFVGEMVFHLLSNIIVYPLARFTIASVKKYVDIIL